MRRLIASTLLLASLPAPAQADITRIPTGADPRAFQKLVDSAVYGDTVVVAPGKYFHVVIRPGIHLMSEKGPDETKLLTARAEFADSLSVIEGFDFDAPLEAEGVIWATNSQLSVRNCYVRNGWAGIRAENSDITVRDCRITDCFHGFWFYESKGRILDNEITKCRRGISLVSSSPIVQRNVIKGNSLGISVSEHSEPSIGGTLATANRVFGNPGGFVKNEALAKRNGIRTLQPMTLDVPYNFWGSDCPNPDKFRGDITFRPWVDETGSRALDECPQATPE